MKYFKDVDSGNIVRITDDDDIFFLRPNTILWIKSLPDSNYEREYWIGQGNTCMFSIDENDALEIIRKWGAI